MDPAEVRDRLEEWFSVEILTSNLTIGTLVQLIAAIAAATIVAVLIRRVVMRALLRRHLNRGVAYAISRGVQYTVASLGVFVAVQLVGVDLSSLGLVFGLLSVGIGFGLQSITANFIAGLVLLIERPVTVGDRVSIGDTEGQIEAIGIRSTLVRSLQNQAIIVPNSDLVTNNVINWSHGDPRIRLSIPVGVSYSSDAEAVRDALLSVARRHPDVLREPEPHVRLNAFGDSAWDMELLVWLGTPTHWRDIRSVINFAIVEEFRERGVEIPFPQRDLHFRSSDLDRPPAIEAP
ncbi:MAG: mechanosensitive ion channel [Dehalococcoidia bacterium]